MFEISKKNAFKELPIFERDIKFRLKFGARSAKEETELTAKIAQCAKALESTNPTTQKNAYIDIMKYNIQLLELYIVDPTDLEYLAACMREENGEDEILSHEDIGQIISELKSRSDDELEADTGKK